MAALRIAKVVYRTTRCVARSAIKLASGHKVIYPEFAAATIDRDDVLVIQQQLLEEPEGQWSDPTPILEMERRIAQWNGSAGAVSFISGRVALSAVIIAVGSNI